VSLPWLEGLERAKRSVRIPVVLTPAEVHALLSCLGGVKWLMASLLYRAGFRLRECLQLRVKDVDFVYRQLVVRRGKGGKDRVSTTMIYAHVLNKGGRAVRNPLDTTRLEER
jgi:integrase